MTDSYPVRLHPRAEQDASAAYRWYQERNPTIAEIFFVELNSAMDRISKQSAAMAAVGRFVSAIRPWQISVQRRISVEAAAH